MLICRSSVRNWQLSLSEARIVFVGILTGRKYDAKDPGNVIFFFSSSIFGRPTFKLTFTLKFGILLKFSWKRDKQKVFWRKSKFRAEDPLEKFLIWTWGIWIWIAVVAVETSFPSFVARNQNIYGDKTHHCWSIFSIYQIIRIFKDDFKSALLNFFFTFL